MTQNPAPKPVEQTVVEQQTVQEIADPVSPATPTTVVSKTTSVTAPDKGLNVVAVLGFILAVIALFFYNIYAIPGIVAVILSSLGLSQINHDGSAGRGFATWGILLGLFAIVWVVLQYLGVVQAEGMLFNFLRNSFGFTR